MQRKNKKRLASIARLARQAAPALPVSSPTNSWKLYRRTTDLPLDHFITAYCDEDLTALVREGNPPAEAIAQAWDTIQLEWEEKMQDDTYKDIEDIVKEINGYKTQYNAIRTIVEVLRFMPVPAWVEELQPELDRWLGEPYPLDLSSKDTFIAQLEGAMGIATRYLTEALAMEATLPKVPKTEHAKKVSHDYFDEVIVNLSRYNHYKISKRETTVSEFCVMVQEMRRGIAAAARVNNN